MFWPRGPASHPLETIPAGRESAPRPVPSSAQYRLRQQEPSAHVRHGYSVHPSDPLRVPRRASTRVPCLFRGRRDHLYLQSRVASHDSLKQTRDVLCALRPQCPLPDLALARPHHCPSRDRMFPAVSSRRVPARAEQAQLQEASMFWVPKTDTIGRVQKSSDVESDRRGQRLCKWCAWRRKSGGKVTSPIWMIAHQRSPHSL
jgi:hypothetical protein